MKKEVVSQKSSNIHLSYLLWWNFDPQEVEKQTKEYFTLKITQSHRGLSFLLIIFSTILTIFAIFFLNGSKSGLTDAFIFFIIGVFVYRGHKWAMIVAMVYWTLTRLFAPFLGLSIFSLHYALGFNFYFSIVMWAIFMHEFYCAYQVERLRSKVGPFL